MVTEIYLEQLKWFTQKLREIRAMQDGYHSSIFLNPTELISSCITPSFNTSNITPDNHIIRMLEEIKGILTSKREIQIGQLTYSNLNNGQFEIYGCTTELLMKYSEFAFGKVTSLFGEGQDDRGRVILTYRGLESIIKIGGNELAIFRCLLKDFNKKVSYNDLYTAIRNMKNLTRGSRVSGPLTKKENASVQSAVNEVKIKLKKITGYEDFPEIIETVHGIGYKMVI